MSAAKKPPTTTPIIEIQKKNKNISLKIVLISFSILSSLNSDLPKAI
jgi:hypothetical protein